MDPYTRGHCFWISKEDIKAKGIFLQVFSLNVAKVGLGTDKRASLTSEANHVIISHLNIQGRTHFQSSLDSGSHNLN